MLIDIPVPNHLPLSDDPRVEEFLRESDLRIEQFTRNLHPPIHNFVACDFRVVDATLAWINENDLASGDSACEWGSGFGVVAMLAAMHGYDACGIEVEGDLIDQAEKLAEDFEIAVRFAQGSFIPDDADDLIDSFVDISHVDTDSRSAYCDLDQELDDFDLFFAFPWPGEQPYWETIFDRYAASGALFLSYHGIDQMKLQRKA